MTEPEPPPRDAWSDEEPVPVEPWVRELVRYLDTAIAIPGTNVRMGLDALVGFFFPVVGDWLGAFAALVLLRAALARRVPPVIVLRMVLNVVVDTLIGMVPVAGDLFDVAFQANRRNLELLERHAREGRPRAGDYAVVALAALAVLGLAALPVVLAAVIIRSLAAE